MAKVIDLRSHGGDLVLVGRNLVLPSSVEQVTAGDEPLVGSVRYNYDKGLPEFYIQVGNDYLWNAVALEEVDGTDGAAAAVLRSGDTMTGDLTFSNAQLRLWSGTVSAPALTFAAKPTTGLMVDSSGFLGIIANGLRTVEVKNTEVVVHGAVTSDTIATGSFDADSVTAASLTVSGSSTLGSAQATSVTTANLSSNAATLRNVTATALTANTANIVAVRAQSVEVAPPAPQAGLVAQIDLLTAGALWQVTHETGHSLTIAYQSNTAFTLYANGTIRGEHFTGSASSVGGADLSERYEADAIYEPGTVVVIGGLAEITIGTRFADARVAGVISSAPGLRMNDMAGPDTTHPHVALKGRIPCKIVGPVAKGDILVSSATPGHAQAIAREHVPPAAIVGRALQDFPGSGTGTIEIKV